MILDQFVQTIASRQRIVFVLQRRQQRGQGTKPVLRKKVGNRTAALPRYVRGRLAGVKATARHHVVDHALQPDTLTVLWRIDARDTIAVQLFYFVGHNDTATATEYLNVACLPLAQHIDHVLKVLDVAALIRADCNALHVFLYCRIDDLGNRAVMTEVNDLGTSPLQNSAHDVYRCIVSVKQTCGGDKSDMDIGTILPFNWS